MLRVFVAVFVSALVATIASTEESGDQQAKAERLKLMIRSVSDVEMTLADESELLLDKKPVLRWSNPVSGITDGTVFVWKKDGRPQAAVQVFQVPDGTWLQEYQSLATSDIDAFRGSTPLWSPRSAGVEMQSIPGAPAPTASKPGRLVQMRGIVRQFTASDQFEDTEPYELRLLASPLCRYGNEEGAIIDGALFAFTHGTDPEVLISIEAEKKDGLPEWKIGFAPLTSYAVEVNRKGAIFWQCTRRPPPNKVTDTFFLHIYKP